MTRRKKTMVLLGIGAAILAWMLYKRAMERKAAAIAAAQALRTPPPALV